MDAGNDCVTCMRLRAALAADLFAPRRQRRCYYIRTVELRRQCRATSSHRIGSGEPPALP